MDAPSEGEVMRYYVRRLGAITPGIGYRTLREARAALAKCDNWTIIVDRKGKIIVNVRRV